MRKRINGRKIVASLLSVFMIVGMIPVNGGVFAEESGTATATDAQVVEETTEEEISDKSEVVNVEEVTTETTEESTEELEQSEPEEEKDAAEETEEELVEFCETATVNGTSITVKADAGVFPAGSTLEVAPISKDEASAKGVEGAIDTKRDSEKNVVDSMTFDITIYDADGNEIEPDNSKGEVKITFNNSKISNSNLSTDIYHIVDAGGTYLAKEMTEVSEFGNIATVKTDGFSYYTVEFTYGTLQYVLDGDSDVALADILTAVGLSGDVDAVEVSDNTLFDAVQENGNWIIKAISPFTSNEWMKVTIGGDVFEIVVTDDIETPVKEEGTTVRYYTRDTGFDITGVDADKKDIKVTYSYQGFHTGISIDGGATMWLTDLGDNDPYGKITLGKTFTNDGIEVTVVLSLNSTKNAVIATYIVKNTNASSKTVKVGSCADTEVNGNDDSPVKLYNTGIMMYNDNIQFALLPGGGDFTTRWFGAYYDSGYYYDLLFENNDSTGTFSGDSALAYSWTLELDPGQEVKKTALFALGDLKGVNIKFDPNGGNGTMADLPAFEGIAAVLSENAFSRVDYKFLGWSTDKNATEADYVDKSEITVTKNTTLYAVWEKKKEQKITASDMTITLKDGDKTIDAKSSGDGNLVFAVDTDQDIITVKDNVVTPLKPGKAKVYINASETDDYMSAETSITVTVTDGTGAVEFEAWSEDDDGFAIDKSNEEMIDTFITSDEKKKAENGYNVYLWMDKTNVDNSITDEEKAKIKAAAGDGFVIGRCYDILLYKYIESLTDEDDYDFIAIEETLKPIGMSFTLPEKLTNVPDGVTREYKVVRVHNEKVEVIPSTYDAKTKTISFASDRFSYFAITYKDSASAADASVSKAVTSAKTGDAVPVLPIVLVMITALFGIGVIVARRRLSKQDI